MLKTIREFVMQALGLTAWHEATGDGEFYWRRWCNGCWETRDMTPSEIDGALKDWAVK
ncbi:hypothetical protein GOC31_16475 [Sinorhizobium meliloti]|nr:hypothetical protein [Sinorhizobium meliloti]